MRVVNGMVLAGAVGGWLWRQRQRRFDWQDRVALIAGGSRGLGLLLARRLGRRGAKVVLAARDGAELERARQSLVEEGIDAHLVVADVAVEAQAREMVEEAVQRHGHLDVLINAASIIQVGPLEAWSLDDLRAALDVNFWGTVHACLAALPHLRQRPGARIVNVSSIGGVVPVPHLLPYACGKYAITGFSEGLQAEVARQGVRVTTVIPWLMRTGSPPHALVKGQEEAEATMFTLAGSLPGITMGGERAADRIVRATERGERFVTLGGLGKAVRLAHALAPGLSGAVLATTASLLPQAPEGASEAQATEAREHPSRWTRSFLTALGRRAAAKNNEGWASP